MDACLNNIKTSLKEFLGLGEFEHEIMIVAFNALSKIVIYKLMLA